MIKNTKLRQNFLNLMNDIKNEYQYYGDYTNGKQELQFKHLICGTNFKSTVQRFCRQGQRCPNKECKLQRTKQTNLKKYGCENTFQNEEFKIKSKQTNVEKYGVEYAQQNKKIKEKIQKTNLKKYGHVCTVQSDLVKEEIKFSNIEKYGVDHPWKSVAVREKIKLTMIKKYGCDNALKNKHIANKVKKATSKTNLKKQYQNVILKYDHVNPLFDEDQYCGGLTREKYQFECRTCFHKFKAYINLQKPICRKCYPQLRAYSKKEKEIATFLKKADPKLLISENKKDLFESRHELDIFIPKKKLAIEFNGLYWHSEIYKDKKYHSYKYEICRKAGIKLIQFFEDEWNEKQDICKSMIKYRLGLVKNKKQARKCKIVFEKGRFFKEFFNHSHISGYTNSPCGFGLIDENEQLVAALSLRKPFHKKYEKTIEIARFCVAPNMFISGAFSKLFKQVKKWAVDHGYLKALTYSDLRFGTGELYEKNGFKLIGKTNPDYWYTDTFKRYNRFKFRAQYGKTEKQIAKENNVFRIYGCGSNIYELELTDA